ncbi:MAG: exonuclease domain-containing protein [Firmicutes bacterium]|nr:exonuclease domain-containing protein [Bacillota bacterium]MCM1401025.1 exonuclease domain-containing protein [Bacteroides sp.]MCM1476944.1 exonuclease domain-containing protein [Bacteroides sp.]
MTITAPCVCLDAEFVEGDELLELSIFGPDLTEIYHRLFHPVHHKTWDSSIHHITPAMVADSPKFAECVADIQPILNSARYLIGCAIHNDTGHLSRQGITGLDDKEIVELQQWYWIVRDRASNPDPYHVASLETIAAALNVEFAPEAKHSAGGDTLVTMRCFTILFEEYCSANSIDPARFSEAISHFNTLYADCKDEYDRTHAEGYAVLLRVGTDGYALRTKRECPAESPKIAAVVKVADRKRADVELGALLSRRPMISRGVYRLRSRDIEEFKAYSNGYDTTEHALFNKLQKLSGRFNVTSRRR